MVTIQEQEFENMMKSHLINTSIPIKKIDYSREIKLILNDIVNKFGKDVVVEVSEYTLILEINNYELNLNIKDNWLYIQGIYFYNIIDNLFYKCPKKYIDLMFILELIKESDSIPMEYKNKFQNIYLKKEIKND